MADSVWAHTTIYTLGHNVLSDRSSLVDHACNVSPFTLWSLMALLLYSIFQWSTMNGYLYMYVSLLITQKAAIAIDHAP